VNDNREFSTPIKEKSWHLSLETMQHYPNTSSLDESTSRLLTFQDDMLCTGTSIGIDFEESEIPPLAYLQDESCIRIGMRNNSNERIRRNDDICCGKTILKNTVVASGTASGDADLRKMSSVSRSRSRWSTPQRSRNSKESKPLPKVESYTDTREAMDLRAATPGRTRRGDSIDMSKLRRQKSVDATPPLESGPTPVIDVALPEMVEKARDKSRPRLPGRSRPGVRTHRSGSFALRQFKENYNKTEKCRSKTMGEARMNETTIETNDTSSDDMSARGKPTLRSHCSMDGVSPHHSDVAAIAVTDDLEASFGSKGFVQSSESDWNGNKFNRVLVEVTPACLMPLCGIEETMNALHLDRIVHAECTSCDTFLACINAATMVLCPGCQTISPLESTSRAYHCSPILGFGLRVEDILAHVG
jgi:hypothetical protein